MRQLPAALTVFAALVAPVAIAPTPSHAATKYANCTALNRVYKHGVGKAGARDRTSDVPVRNFKVSYALYMANRRLDRDGDRIACEKR